MHQDLSRAKKRDDESYQEYVDRMLDIVSHPNIELEAKIQYIIDSIQDDAYNKSILYGVKI